MSSRIDIPIKPSAWVGLLAATPWLVLSVFNLVLAQAYGAAFLVLAAGATAGAVYQWKLNGLLRLHRSVVRLIISENGLQAQQHNGARYPVTVRPESRLYPSLIILKLSPADAIHPPNTMLLWAENMGRGNVSSDLHRRLRSWLRLGSAKDQPQQSH